MDRSSRTGRKLRRLLPILGATVLIAAIGGTLVPSAAASLCRAKNTATGNRYGDLQDAIDASSAGDTLKVNGVCYGSFSITHDLRLIGAAAGDPTLDGQDSGTVVTLTAVVTLKNLLITNGYGSEAGGVWNNGGTLSIINSTITSNYSTGDGGGIAADSATTMITNSTISNNTAIDDGGGIHSDYGSLTILNSKISGNHSDADGGAIATDGETVTITDTTISENEAYECAGGIDNDSNLTLNGSTHVNRNIAEDGGGIVNDASTVTLDDAAEVNNNTAYNDAGGILRLGSDTLIGATVGGNVRRNDPNDIVSATDCG